MCAPSSKREKGGTLTIFALLLTFVIIPAMGLGIEYTWVYLAKVRLMAAADAAALAGCRSLSIGQDFTSQKANAEDVGRQYFKANFPDGYLNAQNVRVTVTAAQDTNLYRSVTVDINATIPTTLLGFVSSPSIDLRQSARTSRRNVAIMLVLDRSGSMGDSCKPMATTATNFVNSFADGLDSMGLINFTHAGFVDVSLTTTFKKKITTALSVFNCVGSTATEDALVKAVKELQSAQPGVLPVIVLFTDGVPNGYPGYFGTTSGSNCQVDMGTTVKGVIGFNFGVYVTDGAATNKTNAVSATAGKRCATGSPGSLAKDFPLIPASTLNGSLGDSSDLSQKYKTVAYSGTNITMTDANGKAVSVNAATYAADQARSQGIRLYTIGLDGNGSANTDTLDSTWLTQIANDPASAKFNSTQPTGRYAYAANASQLANAFNSIKAEILRISQ
jgi:Mg-chelatase subunit ChlD